MARRSGPALYELLKPSRPDADGASVSSEASRAAPRRALGDGARPDPAHLRLLNDLSQPVLYKNSADYEKFVMEQIAEQQELIQKLGLANK